MRCVRRSADAFWFIDNLVIEKNLKETLKIFILLNSSLGRRTLVIMKYPFLILFDNVFYVREMISHFR